MMVEQNQPEPPEVDPEKSSESRSNEDEDGYRANDIVIDQDQGSARPDAQTSDQDA